MTVFDLLTPPTSIIVFTGFRAFPLSPSNGTHWSSGEAAADTRLAAQALSIDLTSGSEPVERVHLRWAMTVPDGLRYLGDAWERAYGDMEWRALVPERIMPWYFLVHDGLVTHGYGVKTNPGALCFWMVDSAGVSLWLDLRNGGLGVELNGRTLRACQIVTREGRKDESPFAAARAFCAQLCDDPRLPDHPVYGSNNWYYAYGKSSHAKILEDTRLLMDLAPAGDNRPYMVVDAGWQPRAAESSIAGGPYEPGSGAPNDAYNEGFPDMPKLAAQIRALGARPGIWIRPLAAAPDDPPEWFLNPDRALNREEMGNILDPSRPDVLERVAADIRRLRDWGFSLIKHDFSTWDIFGRWGFQMGAWMTDPWWTFSDRSRTTAEIIRGFYRTIREAAGTESESQDGSALLIGCNTVGHLAAGLHELQRIGDDTSGLEWERTRKYGINALAFRGPQHNAFFAIDADCVGQTETMPWELNRQWLDLLARSGTPLFVSADPATTRAAQRQAIKAAFAAAARPQPLGEPLDWLQTTCPNCWELGGEVACYHWYGESGVPFRSPSIPMWWGTTG